MLQPSDDTVADPRWLREHARTLLSFYYHRSMDHTHGGYVPQVSDVDGTVYEPRRKLLPATCRLVFNFSVGAMLDGPDWCEDAAAHGMRHLERRHRDSETGGYAWLLDGREVADDTRYCYGHAFVLLAYATAAEAGIPGARERIGPTADLITGHFWEAEYGLCKVELEADWTDASEYRGQNANMHACEAFLAAYEATAEDAYLERAYRIADGLARRLPDEHEGLLWEHYDADWTHDLAYNRDQPDDLFRPWGYQPGHLLEWAKLLSILARHHEADWLVDRAEHFFEAAVSNGWDDTHGGFYYNFGPDGDPISTDKYYWPLCEGIGAAAALYDHTGDDTYREWYGRIWDYALDTMVNPRYGNWYFKLDRDGSLHEGIDPVPEVKVGYHQVNAIYEALRSSGAL